MKSLSKYINILAASRAKLGLTQEQLAMQLGISKSLVKMVETNRRSLSTDKLAQVAKMEQQMDLLQLQNNTELPESLKEIYSKTEASVDMSIEYLGLRCSHRAMKLKRQLKRMEREHESMRAGLLNLEALQSMRPQSGKGIAENILLNRPALLKKIMKCSLNAQEMTRKKIALLHAESTLYQCIQPRDVYTNEKPISSPQKKTKMDYTLSLISNRADCQAMIDMANDDKETLVYRKTGLLRQRQSANATSVNIEADYTAVLAELTALQTVFDGLPEGDVKEETRIRITKTTYKKFLLEHRKANYGSMALVAKEYDLACVDQSLTETEAYITALTARLNELP